MASVTRHATLNQRAKDATRLYKVKVQVVARARAIAEAAQRRAIEVQTTTAVE